MSKTLQENPAKKRRTFKNSEPSYLEEGERVRKISSKNMGTNMDVVKNKEVMKFIRSEVASNNQKLLDAIEGLKMELKLIQLELSQTRAELMSSNRGSPKKYGVQKHHAPHPDATRYKEESIDPAITAFYETSYFI